MDVRQRKQQKPTKLPQKEETQGKRRPPKVLQVKAGRFGFTLIALFLAVVALCLKSQRSDKKTPEPTSKVPRLSFKVYWNLPTRECATNYDVNVTEKLLDAGLTINEDDRLHGEKLQVLYSDVFGAFPRKLEDRLINGGHPMNGSLEHHLEKVNEYLEENISLNFSGVGIIVFIEWYPIWEFDSPKMDYYRSAALEIYRERHGNSSMDEDDLEDDIASEWENVTRIYLEQTMRKIRKLRPGGKWCYIMYPGCYDGRCHAPLISWRLNKLSWMWHMTNLFCPFATYHRTPLHIEEAFQIRKVDTINVLVPFSIYSRDTLVTDEDVRRTLGVIASKGADGAVIFGPRDCMDSELACRTLEETIIDKLADLDSIFLANIQRCAEELCDNKGFCTVADSKDSNIFSLQIDSFAEIRNKFGPCRKVARKRL